MSYQCSVCDKSYTTASHLARHAIAHQPDRQYNCPFCLRTYVRQDIARRHSERCPKRQGQQLAKSQGRGQPRKACKRCSRAKISCDGSSPCKSCRAAAVQCSHSHLPSGPVTSARDEPDVDTHLAGTNGKTVPSTDIVSKVPFLLSYTAAEAGKPKDFAKALETLGRNTGRALPQNDANGVDESHHPFPMFTRLFAAELFQLDVPQEASSLFESLPHVSPGSDPYEGVLRQRASDLINFLQASGGSSSSHDIIAALLTPTNLALCIENFFQYAYRHVPIVHKPSFEIGRAELPLLLSIFVVGAVWSYPRDTYFMVLDIVELVERCIFGNVVFERVQDPGTISLSSRWPGVLPLLQAATMIVSISFALPNAEHRRRFRSQRFADLMAVTRSLGIGHDEFSHWRTDAGFEWTNYIVRESCNRVIYYVYLLDCHISILYAVLPRMPVLEMQTRLPSNESAFGADDAKLCQERLFGDRSATQSSLVDVVQRLMAVECTSSELCRLTVFSLFLTVGALQAMIFTAKTQLLEMSQSVRFERALARWKDIWDRSQVIRNSPKELGFMVHAEEVWLLAQKILKSDPSKLISRFGVNDMAQVRQWLAELD